MDDPSVFGRPEGVYDEDGKGQEEADRHREDRRKWQQGILEAAMAQSGEPRGQWQRTPGRARPAPVGEPPASVSGRTTGAAI